MNYYINAMMASNNSYDKVKAFKYLGSLLTNQNSIHSILYGFSETASTEWSLYFTTNNEIPCAFAWKLF